MASTLCLLCCHGFEAEARAAIAKEGWSDVTVFGFPVRCGRPPIGWNELRPLLPADCTQVAILGRACLSDLRTPPADFPPVRVEQQRQCFDILAGHDLVDASIAAGGYLITPAWLADWRAELKGLGFEPDQAAEFFRDFAREIVLLDTGLDPSVDDRLAELQAAVKLPARRLPVGLDHLRAMISRFVLEWRLAQAQRDMRAQLQIHAAELADRAAAADLLARLAKTQTETEAIAAIDELFRMLFAPEALHYVRVEQDLLVPHGSVPDAMHEALRSLQGAYAWTPDGKGFMLRIAHGNERLGLIAVDRLAFPASRARYLNMALAVAGICGLAIENARNRRRLTEAQMMASLGTVVAGVAHEINTPLGISLAAVSTLEAETRQLAERFAARSMTQADLSHCLATAATSTDLMRRNLERIGLLIDAFRQATVEHKPPASASFRLRGCLDDVITSLGSSLAVIPVTLNIDCDPEMAIVGVRSDWASIFVNLLSNSLSHGFKGREQGCIAIHVSRDAKKRLLVDYRDDGVGMTPNAQARVFEPFFTTDLQNGFGLGMPLVYNLVTQRMRGHIACESVLGKGVHFRIEVPLVQVDEQVPVETS